MLTEEGWKVGRNGINAGDHVAAVLYQLSVWDSFEVKEWLLKLDDHDTERAANSRKSSHQDVFWENNPKHLSQHTLCSSIDSYNEYPHASDLRNINLLSMLLLLSVPCNGTTRKGSRWRFMTHISSNNVRLKKKFTMDQNKKNFFTLYLPRCFQVWICFSLIIY